MEPTRILVVDDEAGITTLLKLSLEKTGRYKVHLTRDRDIFIPLRDRTAIARQLNADTTYSGGATPLKVFLIERIASLLLATQKQWTVRAYNPLLLPMSPVNTSRYPGELVQLDALKMAFNTQGYAQYLAEFSALRQLVLARMQQANG